MKEYKLYIFDLDGTLLNSLEDITQSINSLMSEMDWPTYSVDEIGLRLGHGLKKLLERCIPSKEVKRADIDGLYSKFIAIHKANNYRHTQPYDDIRNLLSYLKNNSKGLAVLSNKDHTGTVTLTERHFPNLFDYIIGSRPDLNMPMKPHPYGVQKLIETYKLSKNEVVFIGDTEVDFYTAQQAGVDFIGVTWGCRHQKVFEDLGAQKIVGSPRDIYHLITQKDYD